MKKVLASLLLSVVIFSGCLGGEEARVVKDEMEYSEADEAARQFIYRYLGDIVYVDQLSGKKSQLENAYARSAQDISLEEFTAKYADIVGGNVLGVIKTAYMTYQVDVVFFGEKDAYHHSYEFLIEKGEKGHKITQVLSEEVDELEFEERVLVDEMERPSLKGSAKVYKNLIPVDFYTVDGLDIPAYLGRYDLVYEDFESGEELLIDYSFDPLSTNLPFDLHSFAKDEGYIEYYEQDLGRLFNIYDLQNQNRIDILLGGLLEKSFWYKDLFVACTAPTEFTPIIEVAREGEWDMIDHHFIYPEELNGQTDTGQIWAYLGNTAGKSYNSLECHLAGGVLYYKDPVSGEEREQDLSKLNF